MRTIRIKVYKFDELSDKAKQKAIDHYRNNWLDTGYIYDEAHNTVKAFHDVFGTEAGRDSWLDIRTGHIDDSIMELSGQRLATYIWNNYKTSLYKGKYYNLNSKKQIKHPRVKSKWYERTNQWGNYYYSAITLEHSCPLTGWCYDDDILDPIFNFLDKPDSRTFEELLNDCLRSLDKSLKREEDYLYTDESITENIETNEYEYTIDGNIFKD